MRTSISRKIQFFKNLKRKRIRLEKFRVNHSTIFLWSCVEFHVESNFSIKLVQPFYKNSRRLGVAAKEIEYGDTPGNFDLIIVNDDVEAAGDKIKEFISPHVEALQEQEEK